MRQHFRSFQYPVLAFLMVLVSCHVVMSQDGLPGIVHLHPQLTHLRTGDSREWASFAEQAEAKVLTCQFIAAVNEQDWMLSLRQQDVKESWDVLLNEERLGRLVRDENDLISDFTVPAGGLKEGMNSLLIRQSGNATDDIRVGQIELRSIAPAAYRSQATVQIEINDDARHPMPGRVTLVDQRGTLVPVGAASNETMAVREGVIYTSNGVAEFGVAPGKYKVYGGRGFEYAVGSARINIQEGEHAKRTISLTREVDTQGWVCCDTHVHTVTHSGHGDATIQERMVTLAGEGVELPIATDHNMHIDYDPIATSLQVRSFFTPVIGNEVTTKQGHFNIFPVQAGAATPDHNQTDWSLLFANIFAVPQVQIAILNHGRDIHSSFRPLSPRHHLSISGQNLDNRMLAANAMELINSGAVQTDPMQLFADWCGLINRGMTITPVGSSDSHDVSRYIVGQGRTYIRCDDSDPGNIDVDAAVKAFREGRVVVSYGLMATLMVNDQYQPGDLVLPSNDSDDIVITAGVLAPGWVEPTSLELYVNGHRRFDVDVATLDGSAEQNDETVAQWRLPRSEFQHDIWLSLVAKGQGVDAPYWPTAKPYQADSIEFGPSTFSSTGPVRVDIDGDQEFTSPYQYAQQIVNESDGDIAEMLGRMDSYDSAIITQVASILLTPDTNDDAIAKALENASDKVRAAFAEYTRAMRQSVIARLEQIE